MSRGVIIVAAGKPIYGEYAFNLAASMKFTQPNLQICVVHTKDSLSTLEKEHLKMFSHFVEAADEEYIQNGIPQYQKLKLQVNKYSPFDKTLYVDADSLWFKNNRVSDLMDEVDGNPFLIQSNGYYDPIKKKETHHGYFYWGAPQKMCEYYGGHPAKMPKTYSGVMYFEKGEVSDQIFVKALEVYEDPNTPYTAGTWANGLGDEYCFNCALYALSHELPNYSWKPQYFAPMCKRKVGYFYIENNFSSLSMAGNYVTNYVVTLYENLRRFYMRHMGFSKEFVHQQKGSLLKERENW